MRTGRKGFFFSFCWLCAISSWKQKSGRDMMTLSILCCLAKAAFVNFLKPMGDTPCNYFIRTLFWKFDYKLIKFSSKWILNHILNKFEVENLLNLNSFSRFYNTRDEMILKQKAWYISCTKCRKSRSILSIFNFIHAILIMGFKILKVEMLSKVN